MIIISFTTDLTHKLNRICVRNWKSCLAIPHFFYHLG